MEKFELKSDEEIRKMSKDEIIEYILELRKKFLDLQRKKVVKDIANKIITLSPKK